jgi:hypothetical protein
MKQVVRRADQLRSMGKSSGELEVGPLGRNQGLASVWQNQHELQVALAVRVSEDLQGSALKGVMRTDDGHPLREVLRVGSVWRCPSITWTTNGR